MSVTGVQNSAAAQFTPVKTGSDASKAAIVAKGGSEIAQLTAVESLAGKEYSVRSQSQAASNYPAGFITQSSTTQVNCDECHIYQLDAEAAGLVGNDDILSYGVPLKECNPESVIFFGPSDMFGCESKTWAEIEADPNLIVVEFGDSDCFYLIDVSKIPHDSCGWTEVDGVMLPDFITAPPEGICGPCGEVIDPTDPTNPTPPVTGDPGINVFGIDCGPKHAGPLGFLSDFVAIVDCVWREVNGVAIDFVDNNIPIIGPLIGNVWEGLAVNFVSCILVNLASAVTHALNGIARILTGDFEGGINDIVTGLVRAILDVPGYFVNWLGAFDDPSWFSKIVHEFSASLLPDAKQDEINAEYLKQNPDGDVAWR